MGQDCSVRSRLRSFRLMSDDQAKFVASRKLRFSSSGVVRGFCAIALMIWLPRCRKATQQNLKRDRVSNELVARCFVMWHGRPPSERRCSTPRKRGRLKMAIGFGRGHRLVMRDVNDRN